MATRLLYFASVREAIGKGEEVLDLPAEAASVGALVDWLATLGPGYAAAFADRARLRAAVDQRFVDPEASVAGAREIALFPPVTGG